MPVPAPPPAASSLIGERSFRAVMENVQDMVSVLTADGRFLWASPSTQRVLGYSPAELAGRSALDMIHPADRLDAEGLLARTIATPNAIGTLTYRVLHRDGSWRELEATGKNLLDDPRVEGLVLNARDVTERVLAARQLEDARRAAEHANGAKTAFLSRMSHELRTPLNAILGFAQLLEQDLATADDRESTAQILRAGNHLMRLIDDVLQISTIEQGGMQISMEPVALSEVLDQALELVRPHAAAANLHIHLATDTEYHVFADIQRLRQVLINLLTNAIKYNRRDGHVVIRSSPRPGGRVRIRVADTGRGIPRLRKSALFTPFDRLGVEATGIEGTGLGLALSRRLIEQMNGSIGARSSESRGSIFWIDLHRAEQIPGELSSSEPLPPADGADLPPASGSILFVDDNPSGTRLMERIASSWPRVRLFTASCARDALEIATICRPDLLILDLHLPDIPGRLLLTHLRALPHLRETPVLIVTADVTACRASGLERLQPITIMLKPYRLDEMRTAIHSALSTR
jgi:PAS domain S-box-containing protein